MDNLIYKVQHKMQRLRLMLHFQGLLRTLFQIVYLRLQKLFDFRILQCLYVSKENVNPTFFHPKGSLSYGWIDEKALREFSKQYPHLVSSALLQNFLEKGDQCYGVKDGEQIISFCMYSNKSTLVTDQLKMFFNDRYIYIYNGYTDPRYRGKNLHAYSMALAMKKYQEEDGMLGLVTYVEAYNTPSLKSCYRMGYQKLGCIWIIRLFGRYFIKNYTEGDKFGIRVVEEKARLLD